MAHYWQWEEHAEKNLRTNVVVINITTNAYHSKHELISNITISYLKNVVNSKMISKFEKELSIKTYMNV